MKTIIKDLIEVVKSFFIYIFDLMKGGDIMALAVIYVNLIIAEKRTFKQVPKFLKPKVRELLIAMELEELIIED